MDNLRKQPISERVPRKDRNAQDHSQAGIKYVTASINDKRRVFQVSKEEWKCLKKIISIQEVGFDLGKDDTTIIAKTLDRLVKQKKDVKAIDLGSWYGSD
jgi:hypothetical protein